MHQIAPNLCSLQALQIPDPFQRAEMVVENARKLGCDKFISPADILNGNSRLNLAFAADMFNHHSALDLPSVEDLQRVRQQNESLASILDDAEARLRQILADRQLALELQQQEILLYRQQKLREQEDIAHQEAVLLAQEEEIMEQERRMRQMALDEQEALAFEEQRKEELRYAEYKRNQEREIEREQVRLREQQLSEETSQTTIREQRLREERGRSYNGDYYYYSSSSSPSYRSVTSAYAASTTPPTSYTSTRSSSSSVSSSASSSATPTYAVVSPTSTYISTSYKKKGVFEKMGHKLDKTFDKTKRY